MKHQRLLSALAATALLVTMQSCRPKTHGEGGTVTDTRSHSNFDAIHTSLDANVYYTQASTYGVELQGQRNILDLIETRVVGGELDIDYERGARVGRHDPIVIHISGPQFTGMSISGSGSISATNAISVPGGNVKLRISGSGSIHIPALECADLKTEISGSGDMSINGGRADYINTRISGSGNTNMLQLAAKEGEVHISGSGNTKIWVANKLDVRISGSGDVVYKGNPTINTSISGSGKLRPY